MGGCIAQAFAAEYPQRVSALRARWRPTTWYGPAAPEEWRKRAEKAAEGGFAAMLPFQLPRLRSAIEFSHFSSRRNENKVKRVFLANDLACYQAACAFLGSVDLRSRIPALNAGDGLSVAEAARLLCRWPRPCIS